MRAYQNSFSGNEEFMDHPIISFETLLTPKDMEFLREMHICLYRRRHSFLQ
jgi:hypothetical protein